jgi:flavodoxin
MMNVLVLYHSRSGHTREAAEALGDAARKLQHDVRVKSVIEVSKSDVQNADILFVGTWVHGMILFGVKPAGAELWVPALPTLTGKQVGVFLPTRSILAAAFGRWGRCSNYAARPL